MRTTAPNRTSRRRRRRQSRRCHEACRQGIRQRHRHGSFRHVPRREYSRRMERRSGSAPLAVRTPAAAAAALARAMAFQCTQQGLAELPDVTLTVFMEGTGNPIASITTQIAMFSRSHGGVRDPPKQQDSQTEAPRCRAIGCLGCRAACCALPLSLRLCSIIWCGSRHAAHNSTRPTIESHYAWRLREHLCA